MHHNNKIKNLRRIEISKNSLFVFSSKLLRNEIHAKLSKRESSTI